jgi:hypothetical protein
MPSPSSTHGICWLCAAWLCVWRIVGALLRASRRGTSNVQRSILAARFAPLDAVATLATSICATGCARGPPSPWRVACALSQRWTSPHSLPSTSMQAQETSRSPTAGSSRASSECFDLHGHHHRRSRCEACWAPDLIRSPKRVLAHTWEGF